MQPKLTVLAMDGDYIQRTESMSLLEWLESVNNKTQRTSLLALYQYYRDILDTAPGSTRHHQAWVGGLRDHLAMMCRNGWDLYHLRQARYGRMKFTFDEVILATMCHDAEKFVKYGPADDPRCAEFHASAAAGKPWEKIKWDVIHLWEAKFGLSLSHQVINAVLYAHGEGADYSTDHRVMQPLATFVGNLDRESARLFYNRGCGHG